MAVNTKPIIVVGGNAAGMSAASRARRNDPDRPIHVFEKSGYVSYGSCGLPYFISHDVKRASDLIAITPDVFKEKRNIDVSLHHEANSFDPRKKVIIVSDLINKHEQRYEYHKLIIASGAKAVVPNLPGAELSNVFRLRLVEDGEAIKRAITGKNLKTAVIVGGGYIGLEMAEALRKQEIEVAVVERLDRVMANIDLDMSADIEKELQKQGCLLHKSGGVKRIRGDDQVREVELMNGKRLPADLVVLSVGITPNVAFARSGGVSLGMSGAIEITPRMRTNVHDVYAAGDCTETKHLVTGKQVYIPLGTTANKQGRIAGDNATGGVSRFKGVVGTAVVKVFDLEVARTGITEEEAINLKIPCRCVVISGSSRAGYYPGGHSLKVKLIFNAQSGRLLGGQIIGKEGAAKRIDILATALHQKMDVEALTELDLSYAPPFAPVWDPILIAANQAAKKVRKP